MVTTLLDAKNLEEKVADAPTKGIASRDYTPSKGRDILQEVKDEVKSIYDNPIEIYDPEDSTSYQLLGHDGAKEGLKTELGLPAEVIQPLRNNPTDYKEEDEKPAGNMSPKDVGEDTEDALKESMLQSGDRLGPKRYEALSSRINLHHDGPIWLDFYRALSPFRSGDINISFQYQLQN
jgi:hypothetical protein